MLCSARLMLTIGAAIRGNAWWRPMRKLRREGSSSFEPQAEASGVARGLSRKPVREASTHPVGGRKIRCAIYTRKSSEEGLEQEFNSLDAQREACEAFIKSQRHEGWSVLPQLYDDGATPAGPWSAQRSSVFLPISQRGGSTPSSSTRLIA